MATRKRKWKFKIFDMEVVLSVADCGTCWWQNNWHPKRSMRMRYDTIFGLNRIYSRDVRLYAWRLVIGPVHILFL